ncbi:MAG: amidohydrolase [Oscillospiraceae bacterium]|nr:amidohydrolase [Oscillospiraceae bacterium]
MKNIEIAKKYEDYIIEMRRYFHENPELSNMEFNTMKRICEELDKMGVEYTVIENGGILGKIVGKAEGRKVLLRADIDALPVQETPDNLKEGMRTCVSKNPGVMHACGHDGHIAMLLGAAKVILEKLDELEGTVYLCFERGEEGTGNVKYIFEYIEENNIEIDSVYGIHLLATAPTGYVAINDEGMMAGVMPFSITIEGQGGHGSRPDQSINPIDAFWAIYGGLLSMRLQKIDPYKTLTVSVGTLQAGAVGNVIPQTVTFGGTMRTYDTKDAGQKFYEEFRHLIDKTCEAYHCKPIYNAYFIAGQPTINDPEMAQWARKTIGAELGAENVGTWEPWMASESYGQYLMQWPGVFAFVGMQNDEKGVGAAHHNQAFDIDEDVLYKGAAAAATYALEYLKDNTLKGGRKVSYKEIAGK